MITYILAGVAALSLVAIGALLALRTGLFRRRIDGRASLAARVCGLWLLSTVFFDSYFWALRLPGLFDLNVARLVFLLLLCVLACAVYRGGVRFSRRPALDVLLAGFACLCLISLAIHGFNVDRAGLGRPWNTFLSGYLLPFAGFYCVKYFCAGEKDDACIMNWLFWIGIFIAIIAVMEGLGLRDYVFPRYIADKTNTLHLDRARGPFLNAAFNGEALCIALVAGLTLLPLRRFPAGLIHFALLVLLVPAIYFTRTRSVYLQFLIVGLGVVLVMRTSYPKWKVYAIPAFVACLLLLASMQRLSSSDRATGGLAQMQEVTIRFKLVNQSLNLALDHPFFGVGLGQFRNTGLIPMELVDLQHNHLIGLAAELGLVGLAVYLGILGLIFARLFKLFTKLPEGRFYNANFLLLLGLAMLCNLASNTFIEPSPIPFAGINFFVLAGIVDRLYTRYA
jgi:O-antigen ligase